MTFSTFKFLFQIPKLNLTFNIYDTIMLEHKGVKYNITQEPNPKGKCLIYQYSINLKEPLKKLNASTFQEAKRIVEKLIENADNR